MMDERTDGDDAFVVLKARLCALVLPKRVEFADKKQPTLD